MRGPRHKGGYLIEAVELDVAAAAASMRVCAVAIAATTSGTLERSPPYAIAAAAAAAPAAATDSHLDMRSHLSLKGMSECVDSIMGTDQQAMSFRSALI